MGPSEISNDRFSNKKMDAFALSSAPSFWVAGPGRVGSGRRFTFSYSLQTTRSRFARANSINQSCTCFGDQCLVDHAKGPGGNYTLSLVRVLRAWAFARRGVSSRVQFHLLHRSLQIFRISQQAFEMIESCTSSPYSRCT